MEIQFIRSELRKLVLFMAFIIPVAIDAVLTYLPYRSGELSKGEGFMAGLVIGLIIISQYKGSTKKETFAVVAIFTPLIVVALLLMSLYVSCANGDCL